MLSNALRGTSHLENVLHLYHTVRKASGHPNPFNLTFKGYIKGVIHAAQTNDTSLSFTRNGQGNQNVNSFMICDNKSEHKDDVEDKDLEDGLEIYHVNCGRKLLDCNGNQNDNKFYKKLGTRDPRVEMDYSLLSGPDSMDKAI